MEISEVVTLPPGSLQWIFITSMVVSLLDAFSIGANDVANAFATAVGSGTLTLRQACVIALFTEFLGALALGSNTAKTIAGDIISVKLYATRPDLLMFSMLCAMIGSTSWVMTATRLAMPVSTTHSIVGAMLGVGVAGFGFGVVDWRYEKLGKVLASFAISPAIAGVFASVIFLITKYAILESKDAYRRALYSTPIYGAFTAALVTSFWIKKGTPSLKLDKQPLVVQLGIILGVTTVVTLFSIFGVIPYFKRKTARMEKQEAEKAAKDAESAANILEKVDLSEEEKEPTQVIWSENKWGFVKHWADKTILRGVNQEVRHYSGGTMGNMAEAHSRATKYDPKAEQIFQWVQVRKKKIPAKKFTIIC